MNTSQPRESLKGHTRGRIKDYETNDLTLLPFLLLPLFLPPSSLSLHLCRRVLQQQKPHNYNDCCWVRRRPMDVVASCEQLLRTWCHMATNHFTAYLTHAPLLEINITIFTEFTHHCIFINKFLAPRVILFFSFSILQFQAIISYVQYSTYIS